MVTLDMLSNRRQLRKEQGSDLSSPEDNVPIFPLGIPLLASPAAIISAMVVSSGGGLKLSLQGLGTLAAVMAITAVILAALSIQYIIDGLQTLDGMSIF